MLEVLGEVDRCHSAAADLALKRVAVTQRVTQEGRHIGHGYSMLEGTTTICTLCAVSATIDQGK